MDLSTTLFQVASACWLFVGLAHSGAELAMGSRQPPAELAELAEVMKRSQISLPGRKVSAFALMRGYSLMMGMSVALVGLLGLLLVGSVNGTVTASLAAASAVGLGLAVRYFFILPIAAMGVACLAFGASLVV